MDPLEVKKMIEDSGGTVKEMGAIPEGGGSYHGFAVASFPLRDDHWIYGKDIQGYDAPPMPFKMGADSVASVSIRPGTVQVLNKHEFAAKITEAAKYAVRSSTMQGKDMDFDPDVLVQDMVVGMLGYYTADGLSSDDDWANPPRYRKQTP